jgi:hypothetical protein
VRVSTAILSSTAYRVLNSPAGWFSPSLSLASCAWQEEVLAKCPPVYDGQGQVAHLRRQAVCNSLGLCAPSPNPRGPRRKLVEAKLMRGLDGRRTVPYGVRKSHLHLKS